MLYVYKPRCRVCRRLCQVICPCIYDFKCPVLKCGYTCSWSLFNPVPYLRILCENYSEYIHLMFSITVISFLTTGGLLTLYTKHLTENQSIANTLAFSISFSIHFLLNFSCLCFSRLTCRQVYVAISYQLLSWFLISLLLAVFLGVGVLFNFMWFHENLDDNTDAQKYSKLGAIGLGISLPIYLIIFSIIMIAIECMKKYKKIVQSEIITAEDIQDVSLLPLNISIISSSYLYSHDAKS
jgi:hypothetical protein